jgi:Ca2+-binding RTX toxin-like protein
MVAFVASQPLDMRTFFVASVGEPELSFTTTPTQLTVVKASSTFIARGVGFTYDSEGSWTGGTVQAMEESKNGSLAWKLIGASYPATTVEQFADATDPSELAALNAFLFAGADSITGSTGADWLGGFAGNDTINGGAGNDALDGGTGNDRLVGGAGNDTMRGGAGNDTYVVDSSSDLVSELGTVLSTSDLLQSSVTWSLDKTGNTLIERLTLTGTNAISGTGNGLANMITGNAAANRVNGGAGNDTLIGGAGNDTLTSGTGTDLMIGGDGNDTYIVDSASDVVSELGTVSSTIDLVQSSMTWSINKTGNTLVERLTLTGTSALNGTGNNLANVITGNTAANVLTGGLGNDTLSGGSGNDTLVGGSGNDSLTGGAGLDVFRFNTTLSATTNVDKVVGFVAADDTIHLENAIFNGLGAATGALTAVAYRAGAAAADASDRVIYNSATGQIFYDADGTGAGAQVLFATVTAGTVLTVADFFII